MKEKRLVLDVTTLMHWKSSNIVGIVRVQLELARALLAKSDPEQALFVQFSFITNQFEVVPKKDIKDVLRTFEVDNFYVKRLQGQTVASFYRLYLNNFLAKCKTYIKRLIFFLFPEKYHPLIQKSIDTYRKQGFMTLCMKVFHRFLGRNILRRITIKTNEPIDFSLTLGNKIFEKTDFLRHNDCFISSGLDWDINSHEYILYQKKKIGFQWIGICYDLIPIVEPKYVKDSGLTKSFIKHYYFLNHGCDKIVCISDFTKNQFQQENLKHNIQSRPILKTIHLGAALAAVSDDNNSFESVGQDILNKNKIAKPYILYVSTVEARKNHDILVKVWNQAEKKGIVLPEIVFVGMLGWGIDSFLEEYKANKKIQEKVHFLKNITDKQLDYLYKNCLFTVFPSYMEGWGLAAVESLLYGKVCVISTAAALIEATQGLMPAVEPDNIDDWLTTIYNLTYDIPAREKLEENISKGFHPKDWSQFSEDFFSFCLDN
jgi:glycosyltransferase involved in cell wall biosynthesis